MFVRDVRHRVTEFEKKELSAFYQNKNLSFQRDTVENQVMLILVVINATMK